MKKTIILFSCTLPLLALHATKTPANKTIPTRTPILESSVPLGVNPGLQAYRESGIRLEPETYGDKLIIHNYGHGNAGISLSWGCAHRSINIMNEKHKKNNQLTPVAVLGAGVVGLSLAYELCSAGYDVTIYTRKIPHLNPTNVAPAHWNAPTVMKATTKSGKEVFEHLKKESIEKLLTIAKNKSFKGVTLLKNSQSEEKPLLDNASENLSIDVATYVKDLYEKTLQKGASIKVVNFSSKTELKKLNEEILFNCMGMSARDLFEDQAIIPVRS